MTTARQDPAGAVNPRPLPGGSGGPGGLGGLGGLGKTACFA